MKRFVLILGVLVFNLSSAYAVCELDIVAGDNPDPAAPWGDLWEGKTYNDLTAWKRLWFVFYSGGADSGLDHWASYQQNFNNQMKADVVYGVGPAKDVAECKANAERMLSWGTYWVMPGPAANKPSQWKMVALQGRVISDDFDGSKYLVRPLEQPPVAGMVPRSVVRAIRWHDSEERASGFFELNGAQVYDRLVRRGLAYPGKPGQPKPKPEPEADNWPPYYEFSM